MSASPLLSIPTISSTAQPLPIPMATLAREGRFCFCLVTLYYLDSSVCEILLSTILLGAMMSEHQRHYDGFPANMCFVIVWEFMCSYPQ